MYLEYSDDMSCRYEEPFIESQKAQIQVVDMSIKRRSGCQVNCIKSSQRIPISEVSSQ